MNRPDRQDADRPTPAPGELLGASPGDRGTGGGATGDASMPYAGFGDCLITGEVLSWVLARDRRDGIYRLDTLYEHGDMSTEDHVSRYSFDDTDMPLREAWGRLLSRYRWDCFATLTFKHPRRDPFEIVNAFDIWLMKWCQLEASVRGEVTITTHTPTDAYGRKMPPKVRRRGPWWNRWRKGKGKPVYVLGIENHQSGNLHLHAVIKFGNGWDMQRKAGWRIWADEDYEPGMKLGFARIEPPQSQDDVAGYCSKYVTKGGELVLSKTFNAARMSQQAAA